mmetsp:Transcript_19756/g.33029  ORF Transcript_19756/g.33029 Transcript_19756/m.33029 type:complete len:100 (-) Transcript_19756:370-669(-)|eukprot:CAMPEP_0174963332 /NCGR_PEP_ID=MMETSP0004_2-20121128/5271_1 /TAXON_ID=420556 /ORGANISM="Ochromonas sp., Strain CCMP1393" /LENGTH=99 /DNA_ID=CAMNT_0016211945 /DNA_START=34 /DNA_END=333 /DNA_ORIENTATION=+
MISHERETELAEKRMLDDIETNTLNMYKHSLKLQQEVNYQNQQFDDIETGMTESKDALREEAANIREIRLMRHKHGWMYWIIAMELLLMVILLYFGLTR